MNRLHVYRHDDGYYLFSARLLAEKRMCWIGELRCTTLHPLLRRSIEAQLQVNACAHVPSSLFLTPKSARPMLN